MWRVVGVSLAIASLLVIFGIALWRGDAPRRAYNGCMASLTAQLKPGEYLVDDAECQHLLRGEP
jgi:hypothetical protein